MRYGSDTQGSSGMSNPWAAGAMGAGAGFGAAQAATYIKQAHSRANWALGIGVVLVAFAAVTTSDLNANITTAQGLAVSAQGFPISSAIAATTASLAADVQNLRAHQVQQDNLMAQIAYNADYFNFNGPPVAQPAPVQAGAITSVATTSTTNNSSILIVALAVVVVLVAIML